MRIKSFLKVILSVSLVTTLSSIGVANAETKVGFVYVGPIGDHGWTYRHNAGRLAVEKALGAKVKTTFVESTAASPPNPDGRRIPQEEDPFAQPSIPNLIVKIGFHRRRKHPPTTAENRVHGQEAQNRLLQTVEKTIGRFLRPPPPVESKKRSGHRRSNLFEKLPQLFPSFPDFFFDSTEICPKFLPLPVD